MRSVSVRLADLNKVTIPIGFVGENLHTQVRIDCVKLFEEYPNAVPTLTVNPPMGDTYPAIVTRDGDYVIWEVEDSDLIYNGNGEIQLTFSVDEVVAKSYISRIRIEKSLVPTGEVPTPIENWIDEANEILAEAEKWEDVTAEAETLATGEPASVKIVEESGHNKFVFGLPKGEEGEPGTPGFSPVIVVTNITGGHRVSITDVGGTHTVDIMDGEKGDTGNGIASAVLNQDYTLTLNFTDGTHYTTPSIRGAKGETGDTGNGIASVTLNQDYTLTITYTNGQSTTTTSIRGEKGETGATPVISIGTVTTLQPGSDATASMDVTDPEHPVLSFGIPEGEPGEVTEAELNAVAESKADIIYDTASGAIATFSDGADNLPVKTLTVGIDPVQDLHGYDSPWPAGGGKNLLPLNDGTYTVGNAVTAVIKDGVMTMSGTATSAGGRLVAMTDDFMLPAGTYFINSNRSGSDVTVYINRKSDNTALNAGDNRTFTLSEDTIVFAGINVTIGTNYNGVTAKPMVNVGNTSIPFEPYENLCPISGWDSANVSRTGKNLFDVNRTQGTPDPSTGDYSTSPRKMDTSHFYVGLRPDNYYYPTNVSSWSVSDGAVSVVGANNAYGIGFPVSVKPNTSYCFSSVASGNPYIGVGFYDAEWHYVSAINNDGNTTLNFITPYNAAYAVIILRSTDTSVGTTWTNIQLELGSTASTYEPYSGSTAEYEFPQEAGTVYGGELTIHQDGSGELVVERKTVTFPDNHTFTLQTNQNRRRFEFNTSDYGLLKSELTSISSHFKRGRPENAPFGYFYLAKATSTTYFTFYDGDSKFASASELETWLQDQATNGTPVQVTFELAEPVTYQLTNQQVIALLKGSNNIWADTGDVAVEYPADTKLYIDGKVAELQALILENISNS